MKGNLEIERYSEYPEGSGGKKVYDRYHMLFDKYLIKYYSNFDSSRWNEWMCKFVKPSFDKCRHNEMAQNFGYVSTKMHNFESQERVYNHLKNNNKLCEDIKMFISFMAGVGFFERYNINLKEWFCMTNWTNPSIVDKDINKSLNDILEYPYGQNYVKDWLTQLSFWNR